MPDIAERVLPTLSGTVPDGVVPDGVVLEHVACPLGCSAGDERVIEGFDRLHGIPGRFEVLRCRACGTLRTDPRPTPGTIGAYYPAEYGPYREPGAVRAQPNGLKRLLHRLADTRANAVPDLAPGHMLEIGCAAGGFLRTMAGRGWQVEGIEFSPEAAASARALGFPVQAGSLDDAAPPDRPLDLVVGWMVLEHLHDPVAALAKLASWTRPGGWIALSVPNAGSLERRIFGDAWYALQLPTHLTHFTPDSLGRAFAASGWRLDRILHQRVLTNALVSLGYRMADRNPGSRLARKLQATPTAGFALHLALNPLARLLAALGQTGRMTAWAQKPL